MVLLVNILPVISDHSLYKEHLRKVYPTYQKDRIIETFKLLWRDFAPFKISLATLYSIVWIWGLTGKVLYSIVWIWGLTGNSFIQHCVDLGFNR